MATFYYAICIKGDDYWPHAEEIQLEPMRLGGMEVAGSEPQYCCDALVTATDRNGVPLLRFQPKRKGIPNFWMGNWGHPDAIPVSFCPYCGEGIKFEQHLRFKVEPTNPHWIHDYKIVVVSESLTTQGATAVLDKPAAGSDQSSKGAA